MFLLVSLFHLFTYLACGSGIKSIRYKGDVNVSFIVGVRSGNKLCTGFIIDVQWVLTAAHCIEDSLLTVVMANIIDSDDSNDFIESSGEVIIHRSFNTSGNYNNTEGDLALIKLESRFPLNENISILELNVKLWPQNDDTYNRDCIFIGLGSVNSYQVDPVLHVDHVKAELGSRACGFCLTDLDKEVLVCLKKSNDFGICGSDHGGPLLCDGKAAAVAHSTYNWHTCEKEPIVCHDLETVSAFTYICPYITWIADHVPNIYKGECTPVLLRSSASHLNIIKFTLWFLIVLFWFIN